MRKVKIDNKTTFYLGIISIILSLVISALWMFSVFNPQIIYVEGYIGAIATFMGIAATLMLGLQIFNSIKFESKMKEVDSQLKKSENIEDKINELANITEAESYLIKSILLRIESDFLGAFLCQLRAIYHLLQCNITKENMETYKRYENNFSICSKDLKANLLIRNHEVEERIKQIFEDIQKLENYYIVQEKLQPIVNDAIAFLEKKLEEENLSGERAKSIGLSS